MISVKNVRIDRIVVFPGSAQAEKLQKHVIAFQMLMQEKSPNAVHISRVVWMCPRKGWSAVIKSESQYTRPISSQGMPNKYLFHHLVEYA